MKDLYGLNGVWVLDGDDTDHTTVTTTTVVLLRFIVTRVQDVEHETGRHGDRVVESDEKRDHRGGVGDEEKEIKRGLDRRFLQV